MAKKKTLYVCSNCGYESVGWYGRCPSCKEFSTLEEITIECGKSDRISVLKNKLSVLPIDSIKTDDEHRYVTGMKELDRVLGGGIVKGSLVLIGGSPGIGKSTILLQICENLGSELKILYVSGEESQQQIKLRAQRLNVYTENLFVMSETNISDICAYIDEMRPNIVIVDSIQTMVHDDVASSAGSVAQVRECTNLLMRVGKGLDIPIIIVGHVNKDGNIAGPKVLEHIVDAVLQFEGDRQLAYRILRGVKNRYGSTNEIGVFEMTDKGLKEVENPSMMFISGRPKNASGTCIACVIDGTRALFSEVQSLTASSGYGNARRMSTGFDYNRMNMILAVLEKRMGYNLSDLDVYVNVVGGLKLDEPAADLSVALAIVSGFKDEVVPEDVLAFGEIGLAGEVRAVSCCEQRINEAARLGFKKCIVPANNLKNIRVKNKEIEVIGVQNIKEAFNALTM